MATYTPVYPDGKNIVIVNKPNSSLHPYSRYRSLLQYTTSAGQTYDATNYLNSIPTSSQDSYHYVQEGEVNRLDLIAYKYYKLPQLWWAIALASGITDPTSIPVQTKLRIPYVGTLFQSGGILS